jgi:hypothetical protein
VKSARLIRSVVTLALVVVGLAVTPAAAQAATNPCSPAVTPVRVTPTIEIYSNNPNGNEDMGTLYLGYYGGACRKAYAEMHWNLTYLRKWEDGLFIVNICIHNVANKSWYGCMEYNGDHIYNDLNGWVESQFYPIDSDIYYYAEPSMSLQLGWNGVDTSCGGDGQSHNFYTGANTTTNGTGLWGSCHA